MRRLQNKRCKSRKSSSPPKRGWQIASSLERPAPSVSEAIAIRTRQETLDGLETATHTPEDQG
jgi:hypothetical protein